MIGNSAKMVELSKQIAKVASTPGMRVFITGETGTGKEIVARQIHDLSGCAGPFRAVNCAAAVETLLESELFGHEKGAFTGAHAMKKGLWEEAADGTLFLDEITETSLSVQAKLLRALQEGVIRRVGANQEIKVTARVIAASNKNIEKAVAEGTFREDLYYRLGQVLHLPPLRQRRDDIPLLVEHFLRRASTTKVITPEALDALSAYDWPGNVRQLETVIQLLTVFAGRFVFREDVARHIQMEKTREEFEREVLLALWRTVPRVKPGEWPTINQLRNWYVQNAYQILGKQSVVAKQLGLDVRTVNTILQKEESMVDASEQDEISESGDEG
jgi:transcriptional regulator with GAF, ATPase, and Fis domain